MSDSRLLPSIAAAALALGAALAFPATAGALTVSVPAATRLVTDVGLEVAPTDPAGLAVLVVDGAVVRSAVVTPGVAATFAAVPLKQGAHQVSAMIRTRSGIVSSPAVRVQAWGKPSAPKLLTTIKPGLYKKSVTLPVSVGSSTTKLTALVNGKPAWTKAISAAGNVSVALSLPCGVDEIELCAENPVERAVTAVTLTRPTWPVPGHTSVSSEFGPRWGRMHKGIDIPAGYGSTVVAAAAGKVIWAKPLSSYGGLVMIDHGGNMTTYYAHLSRISVDYGAQVAMGQKIGEVGVANTAHLHFQLFVDADNANPDMYRRVNSGTPVDPYPYVRP